MSGRTDRLIPANTTLLQPGSRYYRISDALNAQAAVTNTSATNLQSQVSALTSAVYSQIYSQSEQTTSVTLSVPSGFGVRISLRANPGSIDSGGTTFSASGYLYRDSTIIGQVGYVNSAGPPSFPAPPNYPWGDIDQPGTGSHTYTMSFYVDPEIAAASGTSDWTDYSATANCYILVQAF